VEERGLRILHSTYACENCCSLVGPPKCHRSECFPLGAHASAFVGESRFWKGRARCAAARRWRRGRGLTRAHSWQGPRSAWPCARAFASCALPRPSAASGEAFKSRFILATHTQASLGWLAEVARGMQRQRRRGRRRGWRRRRRARTRKRARQNGVRPLHAREGGGGGKREWDYERRGRASERARRGASSSMARECEMSTWKRRATEEKKNECMMLGHP